MKPTSPLKNLVIRTAVVRLPDTGYIFAGDPKKEQDEDEGVGHALVFRWHAGKFHPGDRNYNAHTACVIDQPELGLVDASEQGFYSVTTKSGMTSGDIVESARPLVKERRSISFRSVASVEGVAYAVGLRGMVYRLDSITRWTRIDQGLPTTFNIQAIHGFGSAELYAVGREGSLWWFGGKVWTEIELPTNVNLTTVKCAGDGKVYVGGDKGVIIRGRKDVWAVVDHRETDDDITDFEWFEEQLFVSTWMTLYRLRGDKLVPVDFDNDPPRNSVHLSAAKGVMWVAGEFDILSFDGKKWTRIV